MQRTDVPASRDLSSARERRTDLAGGLNTHTYPALLHTSRAAYRLFQLAVHATTLRSWYVRRAIRREVRRLRVDRPVGGMPGRDVRRGRSRVVLDVGCGSGDHLLYALRRLDKAGFRNSQGVGLDRAADAIALCQAHADRSTSAFHEADLSEDVELPSADVVLCITVLQYIREDANFVARMRRALRAGGTLLLYVPVRNERLMPLYDRLVQGGEADYDAAQDYNRIYRPAEVESLLEESGFHIERVDAAYGTCGKLAFELHAVLLHGLTEAHRPTRAVSTVAAILLAPIIVALMLIDYHLPVTRGNAVVIHAR